MIRFAEMPRSLEMLDLLWPQVQKFARWTMTDTHQSKGHLAQAMTSPGAVYYLAYEDKEPEPVGYLSAHPDRPWSAVVHALFWDRRMRGREDRVRRLIHHVMKVNNWSLVRTYEPPAHRTTIAWLKRMGFQQDGAMRAAILRGGQFEDLLIYSYPGVEQGVEHVGQKDYGLPIAPPRNGGGPAGHPTEPSVPWRSVRGRITGAENDHDAPSEHNGTADVVDSAPALQTVPGGWSPAAFWAMEATGAAIDAGDSANIE